MPSGPTQIKVPSLAGGISRQPAHERFSNQVADADNAVFNVADGASKRPGSILVKRLPTTNPSGGPNFVSGGDYRLHPINRDASEKYLVVYAINTLRVFHVDGTEATVTGLNVQNLTPAPATYFSTNSATAAQLRLLSVADYTLIANGTVALGVVSTPTYAITAEWKNYDLLVAHTPADATYHKTNDAVGGEPAGYYKYDVAGSTFATIQFPEVSGATLGDPSGTWDAAGVKGFKIRLQKETHAFAGASWDNTTKVLTLISGTWATYVRQDGDELYISAGTGFTPGWYKIAARLTSSQLRLDAGIGVATTAGTVGGSHISRIYDVKFDATPTTYPSMHDVADFVQGALQDAGAFNACCEWTETGDQRGYFTITNQFRGAGAAIPVVTTNPIAPSSGTDLSAAGQPFSPTGATITASAGSLSGTMAIDDRWTRVAASDDAGGAIDATKAPIKLVRTVIGPPATFTYDFNVWNNRTSGDAATNPAPTIFTQGRKIADMSFHQQRLLIGAGETVCCSASSDLFRFYQDDALNLVDSDPIIAPLSSDRVTIIDYLTPVGNSVFVTTFAGQQYAMGAPEALTPSTVQFPKSTSIQTLRVRPFVIGPTLYMAAAAGGKSQLREAYFADDAIPGDAFDVSAHVAGTAGDSGLLPASIQTIVGHHNSRTVFELPSPGANVLYVYRSFWSGARKDQSAWSKWTFDAAYRICDIAVIDDYLYLLVDMGANQFVLEKIPIFEPALGNYPYTLHIDRQVELTGVYAAGVTTWTLPASLSDATINRIILRTGVAVTVLAAAGTTVTATGDYHAAPAMLGRAYTFSLRLSEPFFKDYRDRAELALVLHQRNVTIIHATTGAYSVTSDPLVGVDTVYNFTPPAGSFTVASGQYLALAGGDLSKLGLVISSAAATPTTICGLTHFGDWATRIY